MTILDSRIALRSIAVAALLSIGVASAADAPPSKGDRRAAAEACRADAERLCANVEKGGGRRMMCLREHESQLSPACKTGLAEMAANRKDAPPK